MTHQPHLTKCLIYCRVSGKKQDVEGSGLQSQQYRCEQHAESKGYEVEAIFPDVKTAGGDFIERKGMVALLAYMDARPDEQFVVLFDDLKRYSRDAEYYKPLRRAMRERGAKLECLNFVFNDTLEGEFTETIAVAASELERKQMARQNHQKTKARIEQGYCTRSVPPIGFKYELTKHEGNVLVHDEPLATIIREALEGFASGRFASQAEVKRFLEAQPDFPKDFPDGSIRQMKVSRMLKQIMYAGYIAMPSWGISMREARHESIINKETFAKIQEQLNGRPAMPARKDYSQDLPLRGAVACSCCGYALTGGWSKGKTKRYAYYFCHHHGCEMKGKTIPVTKVHEPFEEIMKSLRPGKPYLAMIKAMGMKYWEQQTKRMKDAAAAYGAKARKLEKEIEKVVDRMLDVSNPRALKAFEDRIETMEQERLVALERASKRPGALRPFEELFELSMQVFSNPYNCWKNGSPDLQRTILRLAFAAPLTYIRETGCLNTEKSNVFSVLDGFHMSREKMVLPERFELSTSPLPRGCSTPEPRQRLCR